MKEKFSCLMILLSISYLTSCTPLGHYSDPFYNFNDSDFPKVILPLLDPYEAVSLGPSSPWSLNLMPYAPSVPIPNSQDIYVYGNVSPLEKFSIKNGIIMAYSSDVDKQAGAYIQNNYYHWFVTIPDKNITKGFQTENKFDQYIQTLGIQNPDWQTPDEAYKKFAETGCLDWIPDCK